MPELDPTFNLLVYTDATRLVKVESTIFYGDRTYSPISAIVKIAEERYPDLYWVIERVSY